MRPGEGCDASLNYWFKESILHPKLKPEREAPARADDGTTARCLPPGAGRALAHVRQCERSEATQGAEHAAPGLLGRCAPRDDGTASGIVLAARDTRSVSARSRLEATKVRWMPTDHIRSWSLIWLMFMKLRSSWMPEMATIEDMSLSFSPVKSMLAIQSGQSLCCVASILETKFS